jgi:hypothetical protein
MRNLQGNYKQPSTKCKNGRKKWHIQLNESKSVHIKSTNRRFEHIPVTISSQKVPCSGTAKYLDMTLEAKLQWKAHVKKRNERNWA